TAKGRLLGGNLSVLTGIMGSEYFPDDWDNKILYLEDVGEPIYAVDRMMSQLYLSGMLEKINGFVFGKCTDCEPGGNGYGSLTMEEVIDHYIKPLGIPAYSGAMIGHIDKNWTIPNGIEAEINAEKGTIQLLTPAVK
ncbi:MAG TPA: LD-carboxypeptidase, partial [Salinimicrobium sp.]|nr:LD-carboxypeptidase [Salinimicrobium sp.]